MRTAGPRIPANDQEGQLPLLSLRQSPRPSLLQRAKAAARAKAEEKKGNSEK